MDNITCNTNLKKDIKIIKHKEHDYRFIVTIGVLTVKDKKYFIRIEKKLVNNYIFQDYIFYKKYSKKILLDGMEKNISLPFKIIECEKENKYIMFFDSISYDYDDKYIITKLFYNQWLDYTIQLCLSVYYLNHILFIYHNDIGVNGTLRNQMIQENNKSFNIIVGKYKYKINNNYIVIIDFESASNKPEYMTKNFYFNKYIKSTYKYISEVFVVFYISYKIFFNIDDKYADKYDKIYNNFLKEMNNPNATLKDFDNHIIDSLFLLNKKNNN
jgi:hypothetical protein